jgi:alpha-D-ribose 1-methylphosphonate 5-triphosphate synthase subunit PhnH
MSAELNSVYAGGFQNAPVAAAQAFRAAMTAMARPGEIREISGATPPAGLSVAAGSLLLTLCDAETGVHLAGDFDRADLRDWLVFHTGAPLVAAEHADFVLGDWEAVQPLHRFRIGTAEYPDRSATLIVELPELTNTGAMLRGPGIKDSNHLSLPALKAFQDNGLLYPLGLDFFFTCDARVAALPRSTHVSGEG